MNTGSTWKNISQGIGAAAMLSSGTAHSDEAFMPPGTILGEFPISSIPTLQNTFATQLISDITPDPALLPSNTFRWLLVKTENGLALTLPENYAKNIMHFGQQEKFFVRFDQNTALPEISFDLQNWQSYTSGAPVNISREDQSTLRDISLNLQTMNALSEEKQGLSTRLATQVGALVQVQDELSMFEENRALIDDDIIVTTSDLSNQQSIKNTLLNTIERESKLRADTHPIAVNTSLNDTEKTNETQAALNAYDNYQAGPSEPGRAQPFSGLQLQSSVNSIFVPPTSAQIQSTITALTSELSRVQLQINTVNSQISAKQGEITATENEIVELQNLIESLENDKIYWQNQYNYWKGEYKRLYAIHENAFYAAVEMQSYYRYAKEDLEAVGRTDIPENIDDPNILTLLSNLKKKILAEYNAIPSTPKTGTTPTATGLPDEPYGPFSYLDGKYKYTVDFAASGASYPARLRTYIQHRTKNVYENGPTFTVYNRTHLINTLSNTTVPKIKKTMQLGFFIYVLESYYEEYETRQDIIEANLPRMNAAETKRDDAESELWITNLLLTGKEDLIVAEQENRVVLTQQKSELESLKNTKATLQTLYTRMKTIINQLQQHIISHGDATREIAHLITLAETLGEERASFDFLIGLAKGDLAVFQSKIDVIKKDITIINDSHSLEEQKILTILSSITPIIPQDSFSRNGTILNPASEALKFFGDGFRTGNFSTTLGGLPAKFVTQYEWRQGVNDIYPAHGAIQYTVNGRAYRADAQRMNNFAHKELVNGYNTDAITKLNVCIAFFNQYPAGSNAGIENFLSEIKRQISQLQATTSTNTSIKSHITSVNNFTKKTLLQGGSVALFEQLVTKHPDFANLIESLTATAVQKGNIPPGTDAIIDMRHMVTTIMAHEFAEQLMVNGTESLTVYDHWQQKALSFLNGLGDESVRGKQFDVNADWSIDDHGNKYKFGLYHPAGIGNYTVPVTLFMMYSPDGKNTQVLGPVTVSSGEEVDAMKARWKEELLKMKRSHASYSGGAYDVFRGTDEAGKEVFWGKYLVDGKTHTISFRGNQLEIEKQIQYYIDSIVHSRGSTPGIQNFFGPLSTFGINILQNTQLTPQDFILYYGDGSSNNKTTFLPGEKKETFYINGGDFNSPEYKSFPFLVRVKYDINSQGDNYPAVIQFEYKTSKNNITQYTIPQVVNNFAQKEYTIWVQKQEVINIIKAEAGFIAPQYESDFINWVDINSVDALDHYKEGSGKSIRIPITRLQLDQVKLKDFPLIGEKLANREVGNHQILDSRQAFGLAGDDGNMLGNITLKFIGEVQITSTGWHVIGEIRSFDDLYDFDASTHRGLLGEILTRIGSTIDGVPFYIQIRGSTSVDLSGNF